MCNEPSYYFNVVDDSTRYYLDLVMLTNGWRRFKWQDLAAGRLPDQISIVIITWQ